MSNSILHSIILGNNNTNHILILHGLYGCAETWLNIGKTLSSKYTVHLLDCRNHGKSFFDNSHKYNDLVRDVFDYINFHNLKKISIIGHSMGGKIAMFFAQKYADLLEKIVVVDISPLSYKSLLEEQENVNFHINMISFMKQLDISLFSTYSEIEKQIPFDDTKIKNLILKNLKKENGKFKWKLNLDAISQNLPYILDGLNIDNFIETKIQTPVLFIKATNSNYITNNAKKSAKYIFSNVKFAEIENSSHWVHIDQPELLKNEILNFLEL